jgi:hypothetical protein
MSMNHRSRSLVFGFATVFAFTLLAPAAVTAQEEAAVLAPVAAPSVDETSGEDVRAIRAVAAERALLTGDIGSMQEEHLFAIVAAAPSWDETSGYGTVEASRASIGHPAASTTQVPADVRWAPAGVIAPESSIEASRVLTAQQALQSQDLGSLQEEALFAVVAAGSSWDQTSGYASVEASRALIGHPAASTTSEQTRALAAQQALLSPDLGSLQEEALTTVVEASGAAVDATVDDGPAPTAAELLAQFRATELSLSRNLGAN